MRAITIFGFLALGLVAIVLIPAVTLGQGRMGKGGGDPGAFFDQMAGGKQSIPVSQVFTMKRAELNQFIQDRKITNGQLTRQQYIEFREQLNTKRPMPSGPAAPGADTNTGTRPQNGDFRPSMGKGGIGKRSDEPVSPDVLNQKADEFFKRRDRNGDGKLNKDEMTDSLRENLARWDSDGDGLINPTEFRAYFLARIDDNDKNSKNVASIIIQEDELDRKTVVFRAGGAMPANLPSWFKELDYDADGQVALWEWRKGGKELSDYATWDLNDDGFITPEEAMRQQNILAGTNSRDDSSGTLASNERPGGFGKGKGKGGGFGGFGGMQPGGGQMPAFQGGGFGKGGGGGFGKGGFGGFGKKGKKNNNGQ